MKKQFKWEVKIIIDNKDCTFVDGDECTLLPHGDNHCTYKNCPRKVPKTCEDCKYLFFNQNPEEELKDELKSMCGVKGYKDIHMAAKLEKGHYKVPGWCPVKYNMSNREIFKEVDE